MPPRFVAETEIYASHTQFYVVDPAAGARTDLVWDGGGLQRHLGAAEGIVAVGTIGCCDVPVRIELWESEPPDDLDEWDHVGEASLDLGSGRVGLEGVGGPGDLQPLEVEPGTYRTRSSAAGLAGADEMDGGDRYRIQLWPSPPAEPEVLRWWPTWDPRAVSPSPTTTGDGRMLLGAEAHDARVRMRWLKSRGVAQLFEDDEGVLWEHSNLPDAGGTPQLEELGGEEAEHRYGRRGEWGSAPLERPSLGSMAKNMWQTWRYSRGRRPPDP